jgi:hypothetical protein
MNYALFFVNPQARLTSRAIYPTFTLTFVCCREQLPVLDYLGDACLTYDATRDAPAGFTRRNYGVSNTGEETLYINLVDEFQPGRLVRREVGSVRLVNSGWNGYRQDLMIESFRQRVGYIVT